MYWNVQFNMKDAHNPFYFHLAKFYTSKKMIGFNFDERLWRQFFFEIEWIVQNKIMNEC